MRDAGDAPIAQVFIGYDWITVLVVANLACSGLLVSWLMKFADSIVKVRAYMFPGCLAGDVAAYHM